MIRPASTARQLCRGLLALALCLPVLGQSRAPSPEPCALLHVRLAGDPEDAPLKTLLLRGGQIERVLADSEDVPATYRQFDGTGMVAAPAFLDAFSQRGVVAPEIVADRDRPVDTGGSVMTDMREAHRKGVRPDFRVADTLALTNEAAEGMRKSGFGALLAAPAGELIGGHSAVVLARNGASRNQIMRAVAFQHASFRATGSGYPSTLMGYMAVLRQLFLDAQHHADLQQRKAAGKAGPRVPYDRELDGMMSILAGEQVLVCQAESDRDVRRWLRLAAEFGFQPAIAGGRDAWQASDRLVEAKVPVMLTLDWGDEVEDPAEKDEDESHEGHEHDNDAEEPEGEAGDDAEEHSGEDPEDGEEHIEEEVEAPLDFDYSEPQAILTEKRAEWVRRRDGAIRLAEAGVPIVFGSGSGSTKDLLKNVRVLVENGLGRDAAMAALTSGAADLLGVGAELGSLEAGKSATLCVWTGDPLEKKSQVRWAFVDGYHYEYEAKAPKDGEGPADGVDLSGTWVLVFPDTEESDPMTLVLEMDKDGTVTGDALAKNPMDGSDLESSVKGSVSGEEFELEMTFAVAGVEVDLEIEGKWKKGSIKGTQTLRFGGQEQESKFEGEPAPKGARREEVQR